MMNNTSTTHIMSIITVRNNLGRVANNNNNNNNNNKLLTDHQDQVCSCS